MPVFLNCCFPKYIPCIVLKCCLCFLSSRKLQCALWRKYVLEKLFLDISYSAIHEFIVNESNIQKYIMTIKYPTEIHIKQGYLCALVDKNVVTRGSQEDNSVFYLEAWFSIYYFSVCKNFIEHRYTMNNENQLHTHTNMIHTVCVYKI